MRPRQPRSRLAAALRSALFLAPLLAPLATAGAQRPDPARALVIQDRAPGSHVAFSRDGRLLATTHENGSAALWEVATGRLLRELPPANQLMVERRDSTTTTGAGGPGSAGYAVTFSPDGRHVAAVPMSLRLAMNGGSWEHGAPGVWEVATGRALPTPEWTRRDSVVRNAALPWSSPELIAWGAVRDAAAARRLADYHGPVRVIDAAGRVGVAMEGERQARVLTVRELPSGREVGRLPGTFEDAWLLALSPDGRLLAVRSQRPGVELWDLRTLRLVATVPRERTGGADAIAFSPDGRLLAIGGSRRVVGLRVPDLSTAFDAPVRSDFGTTLTELAFSPDGRWLAVSGEGLHLYDVRAGVLARTLGTRSLAPIHGWALGAGALAVARTVDETMYGYRESGRAQLELWSLARGAPRTVRDSAGDTLRAVSSLAFSPDGALLAAGHLEDAVVSRYHGVWFGGLSVWDAASGTPVGATGESGDRPVAQVLFTRDGRRLLALRHDAIPTTRDCSYAECGEDESTEYHVSLTRVDPRAGTEERVMRLGRTWTYSGGGDFLVSPRGNAVLAHDGQRARTRLVRVPTGVRVPTFRRAAIDSAYGYGRERVARFSDDGSRLLFTNEREAAVADGRTGAMLRAHDVGIGLPGDVSVKLVTARFIPGDSGGVALVTTRTDRPGSALERLDVRTGASRELARFERVVDDVLFARDGRLWTREGGVVALHEPEGRVLAWALRGAGDAWLVTTPDGLYDAAGRGTELAAWRVEGRLASIDDLGAAFRVPGLLARLLRGDRPSAPPWPRDAR